MQIRLAYFGILISALLSVAGCSTSSGNSLLVAAQQSFEEWAAESKVPFQNASFVITSNDNSFAHVSVTAEFRPSEQKNWIQRVATVDCQFIANKWQCQTTFPSLKLSDFIFNADDVSPDCAIPIIPPTELESLPFDSIPFVTSDPGTIDWMSPILFGFFHWNYESGLAEVVNNVDSVLGAIYDDPAIGSGNDDDIQLFVFMFRDEEVAIQRERYLVETLNNAQDNVEYLEALGGEYPIYREKNLLIIVFPEIPNPDQSQCLNRVRQLVKQKLW